MFVVSRSQAGALLAAAGGAAPRDSLVDIGAGDGEVGRRFAGLFARRYTTEVSASMRKMLSSKGFV